MMSSQQDNVELVDSVQRLVSLLDKIENLPVKPPSIYFDVEGVNIGRNGSVSLLVLYIRPKKATFIIDVHALGSATFSTTNKNDLSLRTVFEPAFAPKVVFDIRNNSNALFTEFGIKVDGIKDIQPMELATRRGSQKFVAGLAKWIEKGAPVGAATKQRWRIAKDAGSHLFNLKHGGRYRIFNKRPLSSEIQAYCVGDVVMLPVLYDFYNGKLYPSYGGGAFWRVQVREETKKRITDSRCSDYDGGSENKVFGPWDKWNIAEAMEQWNYDVCFFAQTGEMVLNDDDEWIEP